MMRQTMLVAVAVALWLTALLFLINDVCSTSTPC